MAEKALQATTQELLHAFSLGSLGTFGSAECGVMIEITDGNVSSAGTNNFYHSGSIFLHNGQ